MEHLTIPFYAIGGFFTILPLVIMAIGFGIKSAGIENPGQSH